MKPRRTLPYLQQWAEKRAGRPTGRVLNFYRRNGRTIRLPNGLSFTSELLSAYRSAEVEIVAATAPIGAGKARVGSIAWAVEGVRASDAFSRLSPKVRRSYDPPFAVLADKLGADTLVAAIQPRHVETLLEEAAKRAPAAANALLVAIRAVVKHAFNHGKATTDPTIHQQKRASTARAVYNYAWAESEIEQFRAKHAIGTMPRLALEIMSNAGLRRSDAVRLSAAHLKDGGSRIEITPQKTAKSTGAVVSVPVLDPDLVACLAAAPKDDLLPFLRTRQGRPFTSDTLGDAIEIWAGEAGLPDRCRAHGLRRALGRRMTEAGVNQWEVAAVLGDRDMGTIAAYTRDRDHAQLAAAAVTKLKTRTASVKG